MNFLMGMVVGFCLCYITSTILVKKARNFEYPVKDDSGYLFWEKDKEENESIVPREAYTAAVDAFHSIYFEEADMLGGIPDAATIIHRYAVAYKKGEYEK